MLLHVGLPHDFENPGDGEGSDNEMEMPNSARSGRSNGNDADRHLEMRLVTDLNSFFREREIELDEMCSSIRQAIRCNQKTEAFQQFQCIAFTAFYLDHSQNEFLHTYFTKKI